MTLSRASFACLSLFLLLMGFVFATIIPAAIPLFATYSGTLLGIVSVYLGSHLIGQHLDSTLPEGPQ